MEKEETSFFGISPDKFQNVVERSFKDKFDLTLLSMQRISDGEYIAECEGILGQKITVSISAKKHDKEITEDDLEKFLLLMHMNKVDQGFFITRTDFTKEARFFARENSIRLLSGEEFSKLLEEEHITERRETFAIEKIDNHIKEALNNRKKRTLLGVLGSEELHSTEKRTRPLGVFTVKSKYEKEITNVYVDLTNAEIYRIEEKKIAMDNSLRKMLELPEDARKLLSEFVVQKSFEYDKVPKKELSILEKKGLVKIKTSEKGFLIFFIDELLWGIRTITDGFGELLNIKPGKTASSPVQEYGKYAVLNMKRIRFNKYHDLDLYLEKSPAVTKDFHPDEKKYDTEEIKNALILLTNAEVSFSKIIYLPYYEGSYKGRKTVRKEHLFPMQFKPSSQEERSYNALYQFIDKAPEVPFLFLALMYAAYVYPNVERVAHVFFSSLIFVFVLFAIGLILKATFKTPRKIQYTNAPIVKYGFPSLHSLISVGTIAFVYFITDIGPFISLILIPLGFIYIYSRLKLQVHCLRDVIGGAVIGVILGVLFGHYFLYIQRFHLPFQYELYLTIIFFILPVFSIWYRMKTGYIK